MKASCSGWSVFRSDTAERSTLAVEFVGAIFLILGLAEIRQHVVIRPAGVAELPPQVEILTLAADVDQPVDRTGAAKSLAARPGDAAVVQFGDRFGFVIPGDLGVVDVAIKAGRNMDPGVAVVAAGFQQQHAVRGSALSRLASTQPAEPAPTMMKSYSPLVATVRCPSRFGRSGAVKRNRAELASPNFASPNSAASGGPAAGTRQVGWIPRGARHTSRLDRPAAGHLARPSRDHFNVSDGDAPLK